MRLGAEFLFAVMGADGEPQRAVAGRGAQVVQRRRVDGQGSAENFRFPTGPICRMPSLRRRSAVASFQGRMMRKADSSDRIAPGTCFQRPKDRSDRRALIRAAGICAAADLRQQIRPDLRFHPQHQIRAPMVEKPPHIGHAVDRHVLMHRPVRQPLGHQPRRGHRAGGQQHRQCRIAVQQPAQQDLHRQRLADAGGMDPGKPAPRPWPRRMTQPLAPPLRILLAGRLPPPQHQRHNGAATTVRPRYRA